MIVALMHILIAVKIKRIIGTWRECGTRSPAPGIPVIERNMFENGWKLLRCMVRVEQSIYIFLLFLYVKYGQIASRLLCTVVFPCLACRFAVR